MSQPSCRFEMVRVTAYFPEHCPQSAQLKSKSLKIFEWNSVILFWCFFSNAISKKSQLCFPFFHCPKLSPARLLQWHHILCSHTQPVPCRKIHCTEERDPCCCHCSALHGIPCQIFELLSWALKDESPSHLNQDTCNIDRTLEHCKYDTFKNFLNSARYPFSSSSEVIDLRGGRIETAASPHLSGSSDGFCCTQWQTKQKTSYEW